MILNKSKNSSSRFCPKEKVVPGIKPYGYGILNFKIDKKDSLSPRGKVEGTSK